MIAALIPIVAEWAAKIWQAVADYRQQALDAAALRARANAATDEMVSRIIGAIDASVAANNARADAGVDAKFPDAK